MKHSILFLFTLIFTLPANAQTIKALTKLPKGVPATTVGKMLPQVSNAAAQTARIAAQTRAVSTAIQLTPAGSKQKEILSPNLAPLYPTEWKIPVETPTQALKTPSTALVPHINEQDIAKIANIAHQIYFGLSGSIAKEILNQRTQFVIEYKKATELYEMLQTPSINPALLRMKIENTIINNTLHTTLLELLDNGQFSTMKQELEQYFLLSVHQPFFATSIAPREAFALATRGYLMTHPHKPSWHLREVMKFGGMRQTQLKLAAQEKELAETANSNDLSDQQVRQFGGLNQAKQRLAVSEEDCQKLLSMYSQAEELNATIKEYIAQSTHTAEENEAILDTLQKMYDLYDELLTFAKNNSSVQNTVKIYNNLLADMEAFVAHNRRAPIWQNKEERALYQLFEPLVFGNRINQFEEIVPVLNKLYELTEKYPVKRFSEQDALKLVQGFYQKHGFLPRSVRIRNFYDIRPDEAITMEAMLYWQYNSTDFSHKINNIKIQEEDFFPQFY